MPLSFGRYAASPLILPKCNSWVSVLVVFDHGLEDLSSVVLYGICSCHIHFQHVAITSWLGRYHQAGTIGHICLTFNLVGSPVVQVRILAIPESHSPFPSNRTLHVVPQALAQSRIGCSFRRRFPREWSFSHVQTESGGARVEHLTLSSSSHFFILVRFPFFSDVCVVLQSFTPHVLRKLLYPVSDHLGSSGAGLTCVRLHVWRQFLPCTQIVSLARSLQAHTGLGPTPGNCSHHRVSDGFTVTDASASRASSNVRSGPSGLASARAVQHPLARVTSVMRDELDLARMPPDPPDRLYSFPLLSSFDIEHPLPHAVLNLTAPEMHACGMRHAPRVSTNSFNKSLSTSVELETCHLAPVQLSFWVRPPRWSIFSSSCFASGDFLHATSHGFKAVAAAKILSAHVGPLLEYRPPIPNHNQKVGGPRTVGCLVPLAISFHHATTFRPARRMVPWCSFCVGQENMAAVAKQSTLGTTATLR